MSTSLMEHVTTEERPAGIGDSVMWSGKLPGETRVGKVVATDSRGFVVNEYLGEGATKQTRLPRDVPGLERIERPPGSPELPIGEAMILMTEGQARSCCGAIRQHLAGARKLVYLLWRHEGWRALRYKSWSACVQAEFDDSRAELFRALQAGKIEAEIVGESQIETLGSIPESHLLPLGKLAEGTRAAAFEAVLDRTDGKPTAADFRATVREHEEGARPADFDATLRWAFDRHVAWEARWRNARGHGLDDETLTQWVGDMWRDRGGAPSRREINGTSISAFWVKGGSRPGIYLGEDGIGADRPTLSGKALIAEVRRVLEIPKPQEVALAAAERATVTCDRPAFEGGCSSVVWWIEDLTTRLRRGVIEAAWGERFMVRPNDGGGPEVAALRAERFLSAWDLTPESTPNPFGNCGACGAILVAGDEEFCAEHRPAVEPAPVAGGTPAAKSAQPAWMLDALAGRDEVEEAGPDPVEEMPAAPSVSDRRGATVYFREPVWAHLERATARFNRQQGQSFTPHGFAEWVILSLEVGPDDAEPPTLDEGQDDEDAGLPPRAQSVLNRLQDAFAHPELSQEEINLREEARLAGEREALPALCACGWPAAEGDAAPPPTKPYRHTWTRFAELEQIRKKRGFTLQEEAEWESIKPWADKALARKARAK